VGWTAWQIWLRWRRWRHVWWQMNRYNTQQMFNEKSGDDKFLGFESILLIFIASYTWVRLHGGLLVLETGASYMRVLLICQYIQ
jgi:hypothetical protein